MGGLFVAQTFILSRLQSDDIHNYSDLTEPIKQNIRTADLQVIRNPYIYLGVFVVVIFLIIKFVKMPKTKDKGSLPEMSAIVSRLLKEKRFTSGVVTQLFYVGAQIMCWTYIYHYAENLKISNETTVNYAYVAFALFLSGRFIFTYLLKFTTPGNLLFILTIFAVALSAGTIFLHSVFGLYCLVGISFCMSLMFPTIFGIALEGLGEDAKVASAFMVMAIVGGAIMPVLQGLLIDVGGRALDDHDILGVPEVNFSFILPLICFLVVGCYGFLFRKPLIY